MQTQNPEVVKQQFRDLFNSVLPNLHAYIARQCEPSEVEDLAADVMSAVYQHWDRAPATLEQQRMWVFGFARNKLLELRRKKRYGASLLTKIGSQANTDTTRFDNQINANDRVKRLLAQLPEKECEVIYLTVFAGFNSTETAQILGITPSAVTTRAARARQHLKTILEAEGKDQ